MGEGKDEGVQAFVEAFEYCLDPLSGENIKKWGFLGALLPDKKKKRSIKIIQVELLHTAHTYPAPPEWIDRD